MSPQSIKCCVTFISSLLGAGLPDGWLWVYTSISLEEVHGEMDKIRAGTPQGGHRNRPPISPCGSYLLQHRVICPIDTKCCHDYSSCIA